MIVEKMTARNVGTERVSTVSVTVMTVTEDVAVKFLVSTP